MAVKKFGVLGSQDMAATTDYTPYTAPAGRRGVCDVSFCNRNAGPVKVRGWVQDVGVALANVHYLAYDTEILGNSTFVISGVTFNPTDKVGGRSNTANVTMRVTGVEEDQT